MKISKFINKIIYGYQLDSWNYDNSMTIEELNENGFPFSMACIEINDNSILAIGTGEESPADYIEKNKKNEYILDSTKHPRKIKSMLGNKNVYYLKKYNGVFKKNESEWAQFTINGFKENYTISGSAVKGDFSPMMIHQVFTEINKKIREIDTNTGNNNYNFENKEIGSFKMQVNVLNNEEHIENEYFRTTLTTSGFTFEEILNLIKTIYKNIPANRK